MKSSATFHIGNVPVFGDVMLAPMAGFADVPHRAICRSFGSALSYTEFIAAEDIIYRTKKTGSLLDFSSEDRPMVVQLFGNNAPSFLEAALRIEELNPNVIDINMGCSTRRVSGRGAGVGMMPDTALVEQTFALLSQNLSLPITGKIRLGWDDNKNYLDVARAMQDNGASLIAIHPRTKEQRYGGSADWDAISQLKRTVDIPVIGSGDIHTPGDIDQMLAQTGCQGVMIGRGAIGNPWLFDRIDKRQLAIHEITSTMRKHVMMMVDYYGHRGLYLFRKYLKRYLEIFPEIDNLRRRMVRTEDLLELLDLLDEVTKAIGEVNNRSFTTDRSSTKSREPEISPVR
jgi:nifR3 family TIM-barrel protein